MFSSKVVPAFFAWRIVFPILILLGMAQSSTLVPGGPVSGTWTMSGSPYFLQGDVRINEGTTLSIEPGVEVVAGEEDGSVGGGFPNLVEFKVAGTLETNEDGPKVLFTSHSKTPGSWAGIQFEKSAFQTVSNFIVEYGVWGIRAVNPPGVKALVDHALIRNNQLCGIRISQGKMEFHATEVTGNGEGILMDGPSAILEIEGCLIHGNSNAGFIGQELLGASIVNNTFHDNGPVGIESIFAPASVELINNIITGHGTGLTTPDVVDHSYNLYFNTVNIGGGGRFGTGEFAANPQFVNAPTDFHLNPASLAIDAGLFRNDMPFDFEDHDRGSKPDIGAFEFRDVTPPDSNNCVTLQCRLAVCSDESAKKSLDNRGLQDENKALESRIEDLQKSCASQALTDFIGKFEADFRRAFHNTAFSIPGATPEQKADKLLGALLGLHEGSKHSLYVALSPKPPRGRCRPRRR